MLQCTEHGDVQLRDAPRQHEYPLAATDAELGQHVGEAVRRRPQLDIGEIAALALTAEPAQRHALPAWACRVAVHGLVSDIQGAAGQTVELTARRLPREFGTGALVAVEIGTRPARPHALLD